MMGSLSSKDIEHFLQESAYGHLGYFNGSEVTVLPINFVKMEKTI